MAEVYLYSVAQNISNKLRSLALEEIELAWGARKELKKLENTMSTITAVLLDAEEQQKVNHEVKDWLLKLKDVIYDADDVVDEYATEVLRLELHSPCPWWMLNKVINFFPHAAFHLEIGHKIKDIRERLDEIAADKCNFHLTTEVVDKQVMVRERETHSYISKTEVIGRDREKEEIIQFLSKTNESEISVLAIVGIGGLGTTTLAKLVTNDTRVVCRFKLRPWVHVSWEFNLKKIIESILPPVDSSSTLEDLQQTLREMLNGKNFLLVLDDVWLENPIEWANLRELLAVGSTDSKVLITTRNQSVARMVGTAYNLEGLSDGDCWSLFAKWAFRRGEEMKYPNLVSIGKEIVKKCRGVPLAAQTLGGMLYMKTDERDWLIVQNSEIWEIDHSKHGIMPMLRLSYDELPSYIKQCFAYCAIALKGHDLNKETLKQLWIAQGFIRPLENKIPIEDVASHCFDVLLSRSFFQDAEDDDYGQRTTCKMHALMHDLACLVSAGESSSADFNTKIHSENARHLLLFDPYTRREEFPRSLLMLRKLRTFIWPWGTRKFYIDPLFSNFRCLRVLNLLGLQLKELPSSIGKLKHLRYLNLSWNKCIRRLPNSICKLYNLQTLRIHDCSELEELPRNIGKLVKLRHLYLSSSQRLLPEQEFGRLTSLQTLFIDNCWCLKSLPKSLQKNEALQNLRITNCPMLHISENDMQGLRNLRQLTLGQLKEMDTLPFGIQLAATTMISLYITTCPELTKLPEWIGSLASLRRLTIKCCSIESLPQAICNLGSLQVLRIIECPQLKARCQPNVGEDWPKISHIPEIHLIDEEEKPSDN